MTYTAGSQGVQASFTYAFQTTLDGILTAVPGITLADTYTNAADTHKIYKSAAANNVQGTDFYFGVRAAAAATTLIEFYVSENYNPTTDLFTNYAPNDGTYTPTASFAVNDPSGKLPGSSNVAKRGVTINGTGFQYWVSANANRIIVATRAGSTDYVVYTGLYDDLLPSSISPFPLVNMAPGTTTPSAGTTTREPGLTTSLLSAFMTSGPYVWTPQNTLVDVYRGGIVPSRGYIRTLRTSGNSSIRGLLKDVVVSDIGGAVNGDTLTVTLTGGGTKVYTKMSGLNSPNAMWVDQAA